MAFGLAALVVGTISGVGRASEATDAEPLLVASGGPVIPGLHGDHPLAPDQVGRVLMSELGCASCHADLAEVEPGAKRVPNLTRVAARVAPEYLTRFIADPIGTQPGTTMPHVIRETDPVKRAAIAEEITHFLVAHAGEAFQPEAVDAAEVESGSKLFHSVGCVACHAPRDGSQAAQREGVVGLDHIPSKYSLQSLTDFLYDPLRHRPAGRMPDMGLSTAEARSIASFLIGTEATTPAPFELDATKVRDGADAFTRHQCSACHDVAGAPAYMPFRRATELDLQQGCLSAQPGKAPDFGLNDSQRDAIRAAIRTAPQEGTPEQDVERTLTTFNCIACHSRDDFGGVASELNPYFGTSELALGDPARIPPPLTRVGAKLRPEWLHKVLFDGATVRPYMHTRMPQYGEANLGHLPVALRAADPAPPIEIPVFRGKQRGEMHDAAQQLIGSDMLACINCHSFNGKKSPAFNGIDLTTTAERLQPAWLKDFLINPQAHRPGIIMPQSWPGGEALRQDVLDGDTDKQIDAIWSYLEQGRTARDPKGIRNEPTRLVVTDEVQTYRGRSRIAGYRGIAVGFPEGLNYSFNAETGAWSGIWKGGFVRVRWDSQGAGDFNPDARPIELPRDLGVARLTSDDEPWPLLPVMTEEEPVNPDPLYPRRLGYRFRGYSMDEAKVPTLTYMSGEVTIQDKTVSTPGSDGTSLTRTMSFDAPEAETLYVRLAAGPIEVLTESQFKLGSLVLHVPPGPALLRPSAVEGEQELLLKLALPQGSTSMELRYEVL